MSKNKKEAGAPNTGDQETDEILQEMEDEGIDTTEEDDKDQDGDEDEGQDEDGDEDDEDEEESEDDDDTDEDEEVDDDEDSDDEDSDEEDEDGAGDDSDDDEEDDAPRARKARLIPMWQHKKELKQLEKRLKRDIEKAAKGASKTTDDVDEDSDDVQDIVKEYGLPKDKGPKFVAALIKAVSKRNKGIEPAEISKIKKQLADQEEDRQFNREMSKTEKVIRKLFPEARGKDLDRIKARVKKLAYTERYQRYSLKDIVMLNRKALKPKEGKTGESQGTRGTQRTKSSVRFNLKDPDSIPWAELSDKEFDEVSAALEKSSGPSIRIHRKSRSLRQRR